MILALSSMLPCSDLTLGKTIREGMGQATNRSSSETLDLVITNALIVDWSGIYKVTITVSTCVALVQLCNRPTSV
jgi:urease alpha subunit